MPALIQPKVVEETETQEKLNPDHTDLPQYVDQCREKFLEDNSSIMASGRSSAKAEDLGPSVYCKTARKGGKQGVAGSKTRTLLPREDAYLVSQPGTKETQHFLFKNWICREAVCPERRWPETTSTRRIKNAHEDEQDEPAPRSKGIPSQPSRSPSSLSSSNSNSNSNSRPRPTPVIPIRQHQSTVSDVRQLYSLVHHVGRALDRFGVVWWVSHGSLIGTLRHGGHMRQDVDVDISIPYDFFYLLSPGSALDLELQRLNIHIARLYLPNDSVRFCSKKNLSRYARVMNLVRAAHLFDESLTCGTPFIEVHPVEVDSVSFRWSTRVAGRQSRLRGKEGATHFTPAYSVYYFNVTKFRLESSALSSSSSSVDRRAGKLLDPQQRQALVSQPPLFEVHDFRKKAPFGAYTWVWVPPEGEKVLDSFYGSDWVTHIRVHNNSNLEQQGSLSSIPAVQMAGSNDGRSSVSSLNVSKALLDEAEEEPLFPAAAAVARRRAGNATMAKKAYSSAYMQFEPGELLGTYARPSGPLFPHFF
ncbi:unnamed protein product [Amoebophrya sp. A25]|nr:unnamed protein product [Amoebophrya sp. A25]|eukprot:GSA25T00022790001.1